MYWTMSITYLSIKMDLDRNAQYDNGTNVYQKVHR